MMFDLETIISIALALVAGVQIYFAYNKYSTTTVDKVYQVVETIYEKYKDKLKEDNPPLAEECELALQTMKKAMEDGSITALEALEIAKTFVPLMKRLVKFVEEKYTS